VAERLQSIEVGQFLLTFDIIDCLIPANSRSMSWRTAFTLLHAQTRPWSAASRLPPAPSTCVGLRRLSFARILRSSSTIDEMHGSIPGGGSAESLTGSEADFVVAEDGRVGTGIRPRPEISVRVIMGCSNKMLWTWKVG
jgi:hypothetical protein